NYSVKSSTCCGSGPDFRFATLCHRDVGDVKPDPVSIDRSSTAFKPFTTWEAVPCSGTTLPRSGSTCKKWEPYFEALCLRIKSRVTEKHLLDWRDALLVSIPSPITVRDGYIAAAKAFFGWAKRAKKLPTDPSAEVSVEISKK